VRSSYLGPALLVLLVFAGAGRAVLPAPLSAQSAACPVNPAELAIDAEEQSALEAINSLRSANGLPSLVLSGSLTQASQHKSSLMAAGGGFGHDDPGRSWLQRIAECGYRASTNVTEVLAVGTETGRATVQMWRESGPHIRNLLDPTMRAVGIARVRGAWGWFWTANFAAVPDGPAAGQPAPAVSASASTSAPAPGTSLPSTATLGALQVGGGATVTTDDGDCLNVRSGPGRGATVITCLPYGTRVRIAAGPVVADGISWWRLESLGWAAGEYLSSPR
jgi:uncharacterized protein YkwD